MTMNQKTLEHRLLFLDSPKEICNIYITIVLLQLSFGDWKN